MKDASIISINRDKICCFVMMVGIQDLDTKVRSFLGMYHTIELHGASSDIQLKTFRLLAKGIKVPEDFVEQLISEKG